MIDNYRIAGAIFTLLRTSHKILYNVEIYVKDFEIEGEYFIYAPFEDDEPASFHEAFSSSSVNAWMSSMRDEMNSMEKN